MTTRLLCPSCDGEVCTPFYHLKAAPTNSCLLIDDRAAALAFPVGSIRLCLCRRCGFIFNAAWEFGRTTYSDAYEETQGYSRVFNAFQERLARELIDRHQLRGKHIVEIGCGKGEFLSLMCRLGGNTGLGYDPGFVPARGDAAGGRLQVRREFFDEGTGALNCDFLCCKMTFEHIPDVGRFLRIIRHALAGQMGARVFFQVPDANHILCNFAFWDIYYEHCSYFTASSLRFLFEQTGFAVDRTWADYDGQYLMIEGRPIAKRQASGSGIGSELAILEQQVERFCNTVPAAIGGWRERLTAAAAAGKHVVVWGSGSKAVAFLTTLGIKGEVAAVVDINPFRQGRFMPVTGHQIIAPSEVSALSPDLVVVMNPVYRDEIAQALRAYGCQPELLTV